MKKTGSQIICEGLIEEGVEVIFGFPGGAVLPFYDTLPHYPQLRHILVRHEQEPLMPPMAMRGQRARLEYAWLPPAPVPPIW